MIRKERKSNLVFLIKIALFIGVIVLFKMAVPQIANVELVPNSFSADNVPITYEVVHDNNDIYSKAIIDIRNVKNWPDKIEIKQIANINGR